MMEVLSKSLSVSEVSTPDKEEPQGTKPTRRFVSTRSFKAKSQYDLYMSFLFHESNCLCYIENQRKDWKRCLCNSVSC